MTERKPASKSEAKRVTAQKAEPRGFSKEQLLKSQETEARLTALEAKVKVLAEAPQFIADEARPIYGLGGVALIFDAIAKKLK